MFSNSKYTLPNSQWFSFVSKITISEGQGMASPLVKTALLGKMNVVTALARVIFL